MSVEACFEVGEEARDSFINKNIVGKLPEDIRVSAKQRAISIVTI